ncbi:MAG: PSD1 and planctomycete cytochrome C domain-containing protein [Pirellulales bacterium]
MKYLSHLTGLSLLALLSLILTGFASAADLPPAHLQPVDFAKDVQPIFAKHCVGCHGPEKQRSSFRLDQRAKALKGGDLGTAIEPGKSAESALVRMVAGLEEGLQMPPEGEKLTAAEIGILRRWIDDGVAWPDALAGPSDENPADWWSLRPLMAVEVPKLPDAGKAWGRTPIDAFIYDRLQQAGLKPSREADRRTLIRRLTFDLHGLPPTPEETQAFVNDKSPNAYENLVDRLLNDPRYGERWARHWLDVAHYADSHGQDQDRPRPNSWPYRDYLIKSFNSNKPYARFVAEQIAGDVLFPQDPEAIVATGFLAAGPWDESTLRDIREDSIDRLAGQNLDRDDMVTSTMSTFAGMTVGCARCHDHKFDPITQEDYYSLQAVFAGIDKAERAFDADPQVAKKRADLKGELARLSSLKDKVDPSLLTPEVQSAVAKIEVVQKEIANRWTTLVPRSWKAEQGSILKALQDQSILAMGTRPEKETYEVIAPVTTAKVTGLRLEVMADETLPMKGPGRCDNGNWHLSEIQDTVISPNDPKENRPVKLTKAVADFDQAGWGIPRALDGDPATAWGIHPQVGVSHQAVFELEQPLTLAPGETLKVVLQQLHGGGHLIGRFRLSVTDAADALSPSVAGAPAAMQELFAIPAEQRGNVHKCELGRLVVEGQVKSELAALPPEQKVYCGTNQFTPDGSFRPVAMPRKVQMLTRGDINKPGKVALPGALHSIAGLPSRFATEEGMPDGPRRVALAQWLTDTNNPLTWRVVVNRVWHYHFGKGIVETPNDLGKMGGKPSHPELLQWLAKEFRDGGGSLKDLHRLIVCSSVYRQSCDGNAAAEAIDGNNRLLWRMNRGKLDAESLRDAVLLVSGRLDPTMYGPPVMHFLMKPAIHVTPGADYDQFDVDSVAARRRSVYRFVFRTQPDPLLEVLDCPDASQAAPVRTTSFSGLQALTLWNNKFVLRNAEHLAQQAQGQSPELARQVDWACERLFCRLPTTEERATWTKYAEQFGMANLCRVLLNSSEFVFIE